MSTCSRCKRPLKNPDSVRIGMGPTCYKKFLAQNGMSPDAGDSNTRFKPSEDLVVSRDIHGTICSIRHVIVKHSPTGLEWGYGGSGPADLALNTLFHYSEDLEFSQQHYQDFKFEVIGGIPREGGTVTKEFILEWIKNKRDEPRPPFVSREVGAALRNNE